MTPTRRIVALLTTLTLISGQIGCATIGSVSAPTFSKQKQMEDARQFAVEYEQEVPVLQDPLLQAYIREVVNRIAPGVPAEKSFPWSVRVMADPTVNAFTPGGGLILFNAGLLARLENEAQLAMVLAHEMAHSSEGHIVQGIQEGHAVQMSANALDLLLQILAGRGAPPLAIQGGAIVSGLALQAAHTGMSRGREKEADLVGLAYLVRAGYDPREGPHSFRKLHELNGDPAPLQEFFYATHPANVRRMTYLDQEFRSKYSANLEGRKLLVNTEEFKRRTRRIVIYVGILDYELKRFGTSRALLEKALRADETDPVPHYWLAVNAMDSASDYVTAIEHLERVIELDREYAPAYRELGKAYYAAGRRSDAIAAYERYLAVEPKASDRETIEIAIAELERY